MRSPVYYYDAEKHYNETQQILDKHHNSDIVKCFSLTLQSGETKTTKILTANCDSILTIQAANSVIEWLEQLEGYNEMSNTYYNVLLDKELAQVLWQIFKPNLNTEYIQHNLLAYYMQSLNTNQNFNVCPQIFEILDKHNDLPNLLKAIDELRYSPNDFIYDELYKRNLISLKDLKPNHYMDYVLNNLDDKSIYTKENYNPHYIGCNEEVILKLMQYNHSLAKYFVDNVDLEYELDELYRKFLQMEQITREQYDTNRDAIIPF